METLGWVNVWTVSTSALFVALGAQRCLTLRRREIKTKWRSPHSTVLGVAVCIFALTQIWVLVGGLHRVGIIPSWIFAILQATSILMAGLLISLELRRTVRPSTFVTSYLLARLLSDLGGLWSNYGLPEIKNANLELALRPCATFVLLVVFAQNKRLALRDKYRDLPPEATAGLLSRLLLWWITPILLIGRSKILSLPDLPNLGKSASAANLSARTQAMWNERAKPESKHELLFVLYRTLRSPFLLVIPCRIALIAFQYAQPLLISNLITYVTEEQPGPGRRKPEGVGFILAATLIYIGLALLDSAYRGQRNHLRILVRGSLVSLIHNKALTIDAARSSPEDARAITLMSSDVDSVQSIAETFHETWAEAAEVVIGMTLLTMQLGRVSLLLLVSIFACSSVSRYVATHLQPRQRAWNAATQQRLAVTNTALAAMKSIKMTGATDRVMQSIQQARSQEITASKRLRWVMVLYNASGQLTTVVANALGIFSPVVTLVLYAIVAKYSGTGALDTRTAFTSVAILGMVTHPANMVMTMIPRIVSDLSSFERIQEYLLEPEIDDQRRKTAPCDVAGLSSAQKAHATPAIVLENVVVRFAAHTASILTNINLTINSGDVIACTGATGSGKTTLARVLAGELPSSQGSVSVLSELIGLCTQQPWVPNCSIRQVVCGQSKFDFNQRWYDTVVHACCLDTDHLALPSGDRTKTGNKGTNLSGGQRQRVALARALYSRCNILVLDDVFSALDRHTQLKIANNLFGSQGLVRQLRITVFMISNVAHVLALVDRVVDLKDGTITVLPAALLDASTPSPRSASDDLNMPDDPGKDALQQGRGLESRERAMQEAAEDISRRTGDLAVYSHYLGTIGKANFFTLVACTSLYSFCVSFPQVWLKWWTEEGGAHLWFYVGGYASLAFVAWASTSFMMWCTVIRLAPHSGAVLHDRLMHTIFGADMSYFFRTDTGSLLSRFGQDIQIVDKELPSSPMTILVQITKLAMQAALLLSAQNWLSASLPVVVLIVYVLQKVYLQTSRQLRLLDLESRAAIYSLFLDTTEGLSTIRAFGWQSVFIDQGAECLDDSQRPLYILLCLQRWLGVVLDLVVAGIAIAFISMAVLWKGSSTGAAIGIALNIVLVANGTLIKLVQAWTSMEISLGAISRLRAIDVSTPQESDSVQRENPPTPWPQAAACALETVGVEYNSETVALQDVTLEIEAGQKVLVCGRTGSGKSTLLVALLGLLETKHGSIKVDGIDLASISHSTRRSRCFLTIPQDPFVSPNDSLRSTLDPDGKSSNEHITGILEEVGLSTILAGKSDAQPKYTDTGIPLHEPFHGLATLSAGEKQLLSIARALLLSHLTESGDVRRPIVLLDEVTSMLDEESEANVHRLIHERFTERGFTVIMVAHRVAAAVRHMRPGIDAMVWMNEGRIEKTSRYDKDVLTSYSG